MFKDLNDLCGSCATVFLYAVVGTLGYKTGLHAWTKVQTKFKLK